MTINGVSIAKGQVVRFHTTNKARLITATIEAWSDHLNAVKVAYAVGGSMCSDWVPLENVQPANAHDN